MGGKKQNNKKKKTAFSTTLNVSIKAHGCALWKGCEPEQPMHVYLAALPSVWDWLRFSNLVWPIEKKKNPTISYYNAWRV